MVANLYISYDPTASAYPISALEHFFKNGGRRRQCRIFYTASAAELVARDRHDGGDDRVSVELSAVFHIASAYGHYLVAVYLPALSSTIRQRSASPSKARPMSYLPSTTAFDSVSRCVEPQPLLMLTPSGDEFMKCVSALEPVEQLWERGRGRAVGTVYADSKA